MTDVKPRLKIKIGAFVTPRSIAVWPKLNTPDTMWKKPEGEFITRQVISESDLPALEAKLEAYRDKALEEFKKLNPKKASRIKAGRIPLVPEEDKEGNETGRTLLKASRRAGGVSKSGDPWKAKIVFRDAKGTPLKRAPLIWGGSDLRLDLDVYGYIGKTDNTVGITLEIREVKILKLQESSRASGFEGDDEEDGWTASDDTEAMDTDESGDTDTEDDDTDGPAF